MMMLHCAKNLTLISSISVCHHGGGFVKIPKRLHSHQSKNDEKEYLYGKNPVLLALANSRRQLSHLWIWMKESSKSRSISPMKISLENSIENENLLSATFIDTDDPIFNTIIKLARKKKVKITFVPEPSTLERLCPGKLHQNVVLETFPLLLDEIAHLSKPNFCDYNYDIVGYGKNEDRRIPFQNKSQFPLWLLIDSVLDPQNMGAMIRSCCYFNIDGIIIPVKNSSRMSPTVSKTSAGSLEIFNHLFYTRSLSTFLKKSKANGWTLIGTLPPSSEIKSNEQKISIIYSTEPHKLQSPTILIIGNEGQGVDEKLSKLCDCHLTIPTYQPRNTANFLDSSSKAASVHDDSQNDILLDSLNVSVALGILLFHLKSANPTQ